MDSGNEPLTVTIALCTFNGEAFLEEQLESIATQTHLPDEVVIGDDHSTDSTLALIERFRLRAPFPITVLTKEANVGTSANFTRTTRSTRGDIVFLSDQDDRWSPCKIERMVAEFERRPELLLLHTNARLVDAGGKSLGTDLFGALEMSADEIHCVRNGHAFDAFLRRNLATGATMAVRRQLLRIALPTPPEWVHDEWIATIAAGLGPGSVDVLEDTLIDYRQHGNNQIGARRATFLEKLERMFRERGNFYDWQLQRAAALRRKIGALGPVIPPENVEALDEKLVHLSFRASLPSRRLQRVAPMLAEITAGRYARYSTGIRSVVRDMFERA